MSEKKKTNPKKTPQTSKNLKFSEPHHQKLEKNLGMLKAMIFGHGWYLLLQLAKPKVMLGLR